MSDATTAKLGETCGVCGGTVMLDKAISRRRRCSCKRTAAGEATDHDPIETPAHYTWLPGVECREVARHFSYHAGSALKYLWRHRHKGAPLADLRKAIRHLGYELERLETEPLDLEDRHDV